MGRPVVSTATASLVAGARDGRGRRTDGVCRAPNHRRTTETEWKMMLRDGRGKSERMREREISNGRVGWLVVGGKKDPETEI